jgi:hypothetical protein
MFVINVLRLLVITFNIEDCNKATIVGFSTIEELKSSKLRHLPFGKAYLKPLRELQNIEKLQSYV